MRPNQAPELIVFSLLLAGVLPVAGAQSVEKPAALVADGGGGGESYQLCTLADGRLSLLTDGKSRNEPSARSRDGELVGYSSTRRNGKDTDLHVMNPRDPKTDRMVAERNDSVAPTSPSTQDPASAGFLLLDCT